MEGPGLRTAIWFQGCDLACPGCCNPEFLPREGGELWDPGALADLVCGLYDGVPGPGNGGVGSAGPDAAEPVEGVTLLGGEPLQQPRGLAAFLRHLGKKPGRQPGNSVSSQSGTPDGPGPGVILTVPVPWLLRKDPA